MEPQGSLGVEGDFSLQLALLVPSLRSEAVTHDLEDLTMQPSPSLPPLKERKNVLQRRLQQRRTREQLVEQGIMPPLKCPAAFHEQIRSLQRSRTENFLKHKFRSRPERSELVRMHILQETHVEPSLQATQMMLKRARLADDLNEKLAQRPGPMELVVKNILPVEPSLVKDGITDPPDGEVENDFPKTKTPDVYNFDEDSSDALSPEQPASQESQSSSAPSPSPRTPRVTEAPVALSTSPPTSSITMKHCPPTSQSTTDFFNFSHVSTNEHQNNNNLLVTTPQPITIVAPPKPGPMLVKQSQPKTPNDKSRSKKNKDPKPRVKKLKYHQYIPPDQKQEANEAPMDSAYARLLHQQQQFLQLQILSQQQQHYNYQTILPAPLKSTEGQNNCSSVSLSGSSLSSPIMVSLPSASPARSNQTLTNRKPGVLPANLDEMKVAELKMELKLRGLPVSGTKTDLIERLKPYQEMPSSQAATAMELTGYTGAPQPESMSSTPPESPAPSEVSSLGMEEAGMPGALSPARPTPSGSSPQQGRLEDSPMETRTSEKDQRLHEKERQIEELMRKLEQEQRLVEELKMQLEVEKRGLPSPPAPMALAQVKEEGRAASNCSASAHSPLAVVKQEEPSSGQVQTSPLPPFFISHQQVPQVLRQLQPQTSLSGQPGTQILLPVSLPTSTATIQLPNNSIKLQVREPVLQTTVSTTAPGLIQKTEASAPHQQQHTTQTQPMAQMTVPLCTTSGSGFQFRAGPGQTEIPQCFLNTSPGNRSPARASSNQAVPNGPTNKSPSPCQPNFSNHVPKSKDPPRYEEAVKQTRRMQTAAQVPTATSQHMDDLFDVLIESGEISPFIRLDPSFPDKLLPVTASVTTLPFNTVLSRPPPQIQVGRPPGPTLNPPAPPSLTALAIDNQLEAFLEGTLKGETEPRTLRLMEELHSQLLEHSPHSPMDTDTTGFNNVSAPPSSYHLDHTNLDNMEWLDLTMPGPTEGLNPLGLPPSGVFSSDFLDSHDLQLHWD